MSIFCGVVFFNNMVAKVKAGTFWADCLIIRALKWIAGKTKSCFRYVKSHMSLTQKGVWAYIGITIVEIILWQSWQQAA